MTRTRSFLFSALSCVALAVAGPAAAWKNGPPNNKVTNSAKDCLSPSYSTHDWVVDQARAMLPADQRAWLDPHRRLLIIGTEAPDYPRIRLSCGVPHSGYDEKGGGAHDLRFDDDGTVTKDLPAARAQQEYEKAVAAYKAGRPDHAAFFLGAAAHYTADLGQYGHTIKGEREHASFEAWVGGLTPAFEGSLFTRYLQPDGLTPRSAYDAVIRTGELTRFGARGVLPAKQMNKIYDPKSDVDQSLLDSIGATLNKSVNETADMLHKFYLDVVKPVGSR